MMPSLTLGKSVYGALKKRFEGRAWTGCRGEGRSIREKVPLWAWVEVCSISLASRTTLTAWWKVGSIVDRGQADVRVWISLPCVVRSGQ
jgi:hypothetical protein